MHEMHTLGVLAPTVFEYLPALQDRHNMAPALCSEYFPAGQGFWYQSSGSFITIPVVVGEVSEVEPVGQYFPAVH